MSELLLNLEKFGLAEKEARVYLASLELGESPANDIALKSSIPRTLTYDILERLIGLGLVSYAIRNSKKYFIAAEPKAFIRILEEKQNSIKKILPQLTILQKTKGAKRPKVEIFEGKEGMKTVMNGLLRSGVKEFFSYGSSKVSYELMPAYFTHWHKERAKQKITYWVIYNDSKETRERVRRLKSSMIYARYKFMPINIQSPTLTLVYQNKVVLQKWTKDPFSVVIEDNQMAENHKQYFKELWKIAKK